jgi:hypothetical protein
MARPSPSRTGFSGSTVFEFDTAFDGVVEGNTQITTLAGWSAAEVAEAIRFQTGNTFSASRQSNMVSLTNNIQGSPGNQPIIETVSDPNFIVSGMQGGTGGDCLSGVGCSSDDDCASRVCGETMPGKCD